MNTGERLTVSIWRGVHIMWRKNHADLIRKGKTARWYCYWITDCLAGASLHVL